MHHKRAFTLLELLVVIAIIAVLLSLLLPTLSRAYQNSHRMACMNNLRQIGAAIAMFVNDAKGELPYPPRALANPEDVFWWQPQRIGSIRKYGLGPYLYLSPTNLNILRCPTDDQAAVRQQAGKYPFSYVFNSNIKGTGCSPVAKITQIHSAMTKIVMYEQNSDSIDDGLGELWTTRGHWGPNIDLLSLNHDRPSRTEYPDACSPTTGIPNLAGKGNALFADGHVDYIPRSSAHSKFRALPNPALFPDDPELGP